MSRSTLRAIVVGLVALTGSASGADVRGIITIQRKLTPRNVTPAAGLYQRGSPVALEADTRENALDYERSHVVVYLEGGSGSVAAEPMPAEMQQQNRRFSPDLVVIPAGASVSFPNFDPIFHNVFSLSKAKSFDLGNYSKGQTRMVTFPKPGIVAVYCHLHPNMTGTIIVTPNQWGVRVDASGQYTLPSVPPGKYTVVAWHKTGGTFRKTIEVTAGHDAEVNFFVPLAELAAGESDIHPDQHPDLHAEHHAGH
ncbi:MAG: carboxypeptidase regulatory-like domain-containing protein [Acidobacteriia bacterium]|nr:carboxypeptidase regulatory-like domain-containing protein [Terriglobia bacterium]